MAMYVYNNLERTGEIQPYPTQAQWQKAVEAGKLFPNMGPAAPPTDEQFEGWTKQQVSHREVLDIENDKEATHFVQTLRGYIDVEVKTVDFYCDDDNRCVLRLEVVIHGVGILDASDQLLSCFKEAVDVYNSKHTVAGHDWLNLWP